MKIIDVEEVCQFALLHVEKEGQIGIIPAYKSTGKISTEKYDVCEIYAKLLTSAFDVFIQQLPESEQIQGEKQILSLFQYNIATREEQVQFIKD